MKGLWKAYQEKLVEKNINVPSTINELFENRRFKISTNTLPGIGTNNGRELDSNTNENMNKILCRNEGLNDQTINCSKMVRLHVGVDIGEICVCWDKNHDFSNLIQFYVDGTNFVTISEVFDNFVAGEFDCTVTHTDKFRRTLNPSQMITHGVSVQSSVQPFGTSCMENENNMNLFSRLIIMNEQEEDGKSYTIGIIFYNTCELLWFG